VTLIAGGAAGPRREKYAMGDSRNRAGSALIVALVLGAAPLGCGSDPLPVVAAGCPDDRVIAGACAGVPAAALCDGDLCTSGATCAEVIEVAADADLQRASASARPGACIALGPGSYAAVSLPGGVSLLGRGADFVAVQGLALGAGDGAVARGLTVGAGGVRLEGAARARLEAVRVRGSAADGVTVGAGASLDVVASEIEGAARYGLSAFDAGRVTLERSLISGSRGPGLWAQCTGGCACAAPVELEARGVLLRDSKIVGVSLVGARATLSDVEVSGNELSGFDPSGGVAVSACSRLVASALRIADNSGCGLLVDGASAALGESGSGFEVSGSRPGVWIQNTAADQAVVLAGGILERNRGVGLGMSGEARGIIIDGMRIADTLADTTAVNANGALDQAVVGDAVSWQERAQAAISGLVLRGNGLASANPSVAPSSRASVLIDGDVGPASSLAEVTLEGGDEATGIVQQRLTGGGASPERGAGVPEITTSAAELFSVPIAPPGLVAP
jgi:hypothetical protein